MVSHARMGLYFSISTSRFCRLNKGTGTVGKCYNTGFIYLVLYHLSGHAVRPLLDGRTEPDFIYFVFCDRAVILAVIVFAFIVRYISVMVVATTTSRSRFVRLW